MVFSSAKIFIIITITYYYINKYMLAIGNVENTITEKKRRLVKMQLVKRLNSLGKRTTDSIQVVLTSK